MAHRTLVGNPGLKSAVLHRSLRWIWAAILNRRTVNQLRNLDDRALEDIGVSRHEAQTEINRAPWDVPDHWLK